MQLRIILDTNIYGTLTLDPERNILDDLIHSKKNEIIIYGFKVVRTELRETPKKIRIKGVNLRNDLLKKYDDLVRKTYNIEVGMEEIAEHYYLLYRKLGGSFAKKEMFNDFLIVACASIKNLDIVVSQDQRSLLTENAIQAYQIVNQIKNVRTPSFISYEQFKKIIKK